MQPRPIIAFSSLRFDSHRASVDFTTLVGCFPFVSVQPFAIGGPVSQPPSSRITSSSRSCCVVKPYDHRCLQSLRRSTCEHPVPLAQPLPEGVVLPPFETGACPLRPGGLHPLGGRTVRCIVPLRHTLFFPPQTGDPLGFSPVGTWNRRGSLPRPQCPVRPGSDRTRPVWDTTPLEAQTPPTALVRAIDKHKQPTRHTPSIFRTTGWNSRPRPKHPKEERRAKNGTPSHEKKVTKGRWKET